MGCWLKDIIDFSVLVEVESSEWGLQKSCVSYRVELWIQFQVISSTLLVPLVLDKIVNSVMLEFWVPTSYIYGPDFFPFLLTTHQSTSTSQSIWPWSPTPD